MCCYKKISSSLTTRPIKSSTLYFSSLLGCFFVCVRVFCVYPLCVCVCVCTVCMGGGGAVLHALGGGSE